MRGGGCEFGAVAHVKVVEGQCVVHAGTKGIGRALKSKLQEIRGMEHQIPADPSRAVGQTLGEALVCRPLQQGGSKEGIRGKDEDPATDHHAPAVPVADRTLNDAAFLLEAHDMTLRENVCAVVLQCRPKADLARIVPTVVWAEHRPTPRAFGLPALPAVHPLRLYPSPPAPA